jgi:hypothetical protein
MSRVILLSLLAATLASCSEAGPYGYGYAVNGRPSLTQLSAVPRDSDNPFRRAGPAVPLAGEAK